MLKLLAGVFFLVTFSALAGESISVVSYNMGQLKKVNMDFVACPDARLPHQMEVVFDYASPIFHTKHFILLLQEVWTRKAFGAIQKVARNRGYHMAPGNFDEVKESGTVIVSDLPKVKSDFIPFTVDKYAKKGIRLMVVKLADGKTLAAADVHTGYSDSRGFTAEHKTHVENIRDFVIRNTNRYNHFLVGGDFNAGANLTFKKQTYNPAKVIWEDSLLPILHSAGLHEVSQTNTNTWDESNLLVSNPTMAIRAFNGANYGTWGWEENSSVLDHIFGSKDLIAKESRVVFKAKHRMSCPGREDALGRVNLSDHYGVLSIIEPR